MKRTYDFVWYETKDTKYGKEPLTRTNRVYLSKPIGKTERDAKAALSIFCKNFGNLHRITIVKIKEYGDDGNQIGEDIVPSSEEDAIIPVRR